MASSSAITTRMVMSEAFLSGVCPAAILAGNRTVEQLILGVQLGMRCQQAVRARPCSAWPWRRAASQHGVRCRLPWPAALSSASSREVERLLVGDRAAPRAAARSRCRRSSLNLPLHRARNPCARSLRTRHNGGPWTTSWASPTATTTSTATGTTRRTRTRDLLRRADGRAAAGGAAVVRRRGRRHHAARAAAGCVLEDGTDRGEVDALPARPADRLPPARTRRRRAADARSSSRPRQCPPAPSGWGVAAQVYSLWRRRRLGHRRPRATSSELGARVGARGRRGRAAQPAARAGADHPAGGQPVLPELAALAEPAATSRCPARGPAALGNEPGGLHRPRPGVGGQAVTRCRAVPDRARRTALARLGRAPRATT